MKLTQKFFALSAFAALGLGLLTPLGASAQSTDAELRAAVLQARSKLPPAPESYYRSFWGGGYSFKGGPSSVGCNMNMLVDSLAYADSEYKAAERTKLIDANEAKRWHASRANAVNIIKRERSRVNDFETCMTMRRSLVELHSLLPGIRSSSDTVPACGRQLDSWAALLKDYIAFGRNGPNKAESKRLMDQLEGYTGNILATYAMSPSKDLGKCESAIDTAYQGILTAISVGISR
jgi:hypothetical protein